VEALPFVPALYLLTSGSTNARAWPLKSWEQSWSRRRISGLSFPMRSLIVLDSQKSMRIWACMLFGIGTPPSYFVRPRLTPSATEKKPFWNLRAVRSRFFLLNQTMNIIQSADCYFPGIYLHNFTHEVFGASTWLSTLSLMLLNLCAMAGLIIMGSFTDRWSS